MNTINLFVMDMAHAGNTSGVDRYIEMLLKGLESYSAIHVCWIHLRHDEKMLFHYEENTHFYTKITIPLPQQYREIISERFWIRKYNEQVFRITKHLFKNKKNCILHLHTLNLIDLAVLIRENISCKIITHLHCIPWKGYYNTSKTLFNELYRQMYLHHEKNIESKNFITNNCELQSYTDADHIICVTQCAVDFLKKGMNEPNYNISVISNGMNDFFEEYECREKTKNKIFNLLYVGVLSDSKGLRYILKAIRKVNRQGYNVSLTIAGKVTPMVSQKLTEENRDLSLQFLGRIPFDELKKKYMECNAGIIASLQEQSSYVAIEMAMFGLPVITTAVDGLDEIFTDNVNALKVHTHFSNLTGLSVDTDMMAEKIIQLIENNNLRMILSKNVRNLYETKLTLKRMMHETVNIYKKVIEGELSYD
ncbi:glycosyltransferase family 4 protein [Bacteroides pyogenes]|uniref:glycosyltransferase family 4 protein n=1 Tax=Bacteroides pyogenes TaxID=310300 RepID=UPI003B43BF9B